MLFKDHFYTLNEFQSSEKEVNAVITLNADHPIFEGHFPGNPVTPGVVQLEIIKELVSIHLNRRVELETLSNCKFLAVLNPVQIPIVAIRLTTAQEQSTIKVSGQIFKETEVYLKMAAFYCF